MTGENMEKNEIETQIVHLKSVAYDILAQLEHLKGQLGEVNRQIYEKDQELKKQLLLENK